MTRPPWHNPGLNPDADLAPCQRCHKDVVLDHDPPCPHSYVACPECGHETVCLDCRLRAETDMHKTGEWSPQADPFFNQHAVNVDRTGPGTRYGGVPIRDKEQGA